MELPGLLASVGARVDDVNGARIGKVVCVYVDRETGAPVWLGIRPPGFSERRLVAPVEGLTAGAGRVWLPWPRDRVRDAPQFRFERPLTPVLERELCRHYGIPETRGARAASWERRSSVVGVSSPDEAASWVVRSGAAQAGSGRDRRATG